MWRCRCTDFGSLVRAWHRWLRYLGGSVRYQSLHQCEVHGNSTSTALVLESRLSWLKRCSVGEGCAVPAWGPGFGPPAPTEEAAHGLEKLLSSEEHTGLSQRTCFLSLAAMSVGSQPPRPPVAGGPRPLASEYICAPVPQHRHTYALNLKWKLERNGWMWSHTFIILLPVRQRQEDPQKSLTRSCYLLRQCQVQWENPFHKIIWRATEGDTHVDLWPPHAYICTHTWT